MVSIAAVVIGKDRRPLCDVRELASSIADVGLLHPITVTEEMVLVSGLHRLRACEALGWTTVPATIVRSGLVAEMAELDENLMRQELTVLQRAEMLARRKELFEALHPEARRGVAGGKASGARRRGEQTTVSVSLVHDLAARTKRSARTIEREIQIGTRIAPDVRKALTGTRAEDKTLDLLQIARLPAKQQRQVAERLASGESTSVRSARLDIIARSVERQNQTKVPSRRYAVLVVDPPWPQASGADAAATAHKQIRSLPVPELSAPDAVVWLWTTNMSLRQAFACLDVWGFKEKTVLTWLRPDAKPGEWLRDAYEHCILAVRGRPVVTLTTQTTALTAPACSSSRRPDEFYQLVESLCPGSRVEVCAREPRPGWAAWAVDAERADDKAR